MIIPIILSNPIFLVSLIVIIAIIVYVVYWIGKRYYGWDIKKLIMKTLGLYEEPVGLHKNRIAEKVKQYQSFKDNILLFFALPLEVIIIILWSMTGGDLVIVVIPIIVLAPLVAVLWMGIMFVYTKKYTKKTALEVTIHESLNKRETDHWGIETPERLKPDDPRIDEARKIIEDALEMWRKESKKSKKKIPKPKPHSKLYCRNCQARVHKSQKAEAEFCWNCGAKLHIEDFIYIVKKSFCDTDDPWYQSLVYSDVPWEHHMHPLTTTVHIGKIPVEMPCSKVSFIQVGTIMELPFLMFVESRNIIERVKNRERPLSDNPDQQKTTKTTYDGLLSETSAGIIENLKEHITELEAIVEQQKTSSGIVAGQMLDLQMRMGKRDEPKPSVLPLSMKRFLIYILVAVIVGVVAFGVFQTFLYWANYFASLTVLPPPELLGVWGVQYFLTPPGSPSLFYSPPHHFILGVII